MLHSAAVTTRPACIRTWPQVGNKPAAPPSGRCPGGPRRNSTAAPAGCVWTAAAAPTCWSLSARPRSSGTFPVVRSPVLRSRCRTCPTCYLRTHGCRLVLRCRVRQIVGGVGRGSRRFGRFKSVLRPRATVRRVGRWNARIRVHTSFSLKPVILKNSSFFFPFRFLPNPILVSSSFLRCNTNQRCAFAFRLTETINLTVYTYSLLLVRLFWFFFQSIYHV